MTVLHLLKDDIEKTFRELETRKFRTDPIAGPQLSRTVSLVSSAYKRHGTIIERTILECLKQSNRYEVWQDKCFQVTETIEHIVTGSIAEPITLIGVESPYREDGDYTLQVDLLVYDKLTKTLSSYEIKRGGGLHDSGKQHAILSDVLSIQVLLKSYGRHHGFDVDHARSLIIFYYGQCSIKKPFSLTNVELDDHFGWPVHAAVEEVNEFFKARLRVAVGGM